MESNQNIQYCIYRKVIASGPIGRQTLIISLPKIWTVAHGIKQGQVVKAIFDNFKGLLIIPEDKPNKLPILDKNLKNIKITSYRILNPKDSSNLKPPTLASNQSSKT
ncbi:unnamed protein product [marine sediment metagenome]|uniref:SpoVT-AbrB domain-containing protein n=1 Tax=marine sediment metagenome TaxID=412755 RepID=X1B7N2_9ZZZZ